MSKRKSIALPAEAEELNIEKKKYESDGHVLVLQDDFDLDEKEWLLFIHSKMTGEGNIVNGEFTSEEMLKTLSIILRNPDGSKVDETILRSLKDSLKVKILADFFLMKVTFQLFINACSNLSMLKKKQQLMSSMN